MGSVVVAIATTPFDAEKRRCRAAREGLEKLRRHCDSVIVLDNNRLVKMVPNLPIEQAFCVMDQLISEVIRGITETITLPSLINLDFADVKTMMSTGQTATILYGEECADDPEQVIVETLNNPLLDIDYSDASGALIHLTSGPDLSIGTAYSVVDGISSQLSPDANVIFGARLDSDFTGVIRVLAIITGVHSPNLLSPSAGQVIYDDEPPPLFFGGLHDYLLPPFYFFQNLGLLLTSPGRYIWRKGLPSIFSSISLSRPSRVISLLSSRSRSYTTSRSPFISLSPITIT
jgi:cell division protein FtsZ